MIVGALLVAAGLVIVAWGRACVELVAAVLTAAAILVTYYAFNREEPPMSTTDDTQSLVITQHDDGTITVDNAPVPEYIDVSRELFGDLPAYDRDALDAGPELPPMWLEAIGHEDPDVLHDGYMLHVEATNVTCQYRFGARLPEDAETFRGTLASWGER